jgi:hypothetical protein
MIGDILRTVLAKAGVSNLEELVKKVQFLKYPLSWTYPINTSHTYTLTLF